jgi:hypothetical protein
MVLLVLLLLLMFIVVVGVFVLFVDGSIGQVCNDKMVVVLVEVKVVLIGYIVRSLDVIVLFCLFNFDLCVNVVFVEGL